MPFGKRLKNLNNLGGWASFNERKHKLEEQENVSLINIPKALLASFDTPNALPT
jgi:hypothetical protein